MTAFPDVSTLTTPAEHAVAYASAGIAVFPVEMIPKGNGSDEYAKKPHRILKALNAERGEGGFKLATTNVEQVEEFWAEAPDAHIGWVPGKAGCVVLDADGPQGLMDLVNVSGGTLDSTTTAQIRTSGKGGGRHVIFDRSSIEGTIGNAALDGVLGEARGDNGYGMLPDGGDYYQWDSATLNVAPVPPWVMPLLPISSNGDRESIAAITGDDETAWIEAHTGTSPIVTEAIDLIRAAKVGDQKQGRHPTMNTAVGKVLSWAQIHAGSIDLRAAQTDLRTTFLEQFAVSEQRQAGDDFDRFWSDAVALRAAEGPYKAARVATTRGEVAEEPVSASFDPGGVIFDVAAIPEALWGHDSDVLAAIGEPTLIYAATGIGKTTVAQSVALAAIGIGNRDVLGYPVRQIDGRVLYVAADRPAQAMRSLRRMVTHHDRTTLDERWRWERRRRLRITPEHPEVIYEAAIEAEASLIVLDSVKDLVAKISTDESGQAYNDAVQICVANGVEVIALHHPRKATSEGRSRLDLDSVYGSTWVTAGAGSVIAIDGTAGEGVGKLRQLKMPAEEVGPFDIDFDYDAGTVTTIGRRDLLEWISGQGTVTTKEATSYQYGRDEATPAEKRKVRRQLGRYERDGYLTKIEVKGSPTIWKSTATKILHIGSEIGAQGVGHLGRSGVGQGGRSLTRSGSVTETENVDTARPEGVGQGVGQGRSPGSVTLAPSKEVPMTTPAGQEEEDGVCPTCRKPLRAIFPSGLCGDCDAEQVAP